MTDLGRAIRVADPVHGLILVTALERELLDTDVAQRLRWVAQSGLAHYVFPDLRTSRFIHSLGAMHLASQFLAGSLRGADPASKPAVEAALAAAVGTVSGGISDPEDAAERLGHDGLLAGDAVSPDVRAHALLAEQGLRLAALFHDLGHLPYSHDFEFALEGLGGDAGEGADDRVRRILEQREGQDALHERLGHRLATLLFRRNFGAGSGEHVRICFEIAKRILEAPEVEAPIDNSSSGGVEDQVDGAFAWLHTLIAGELDVDRCDYVLRDARSYGFEFARFDLRRLIDNLTVVKSKTDATLIPAIRPQAQAAVESFLLARARMYTWGPRHHKVAQVGAALQYVVGELLSPALRGESSDLSEFVADLDAILDESNKLDDGLLSRWAQYDDQWWMHRMRSADQSDPWVALAAWRRPGPVSLWKRATDWPTDDLRGWNETLPVEADLEGRAAWDEAIRGLRKDGVLVIRHRFKPWKAAPRQEGEAAKSALSFFDGEQLIPVSDVSHLVIALRDGWMHDVQVHAFASSSSAGVSGLDVLERLSPAKMEA